MIGHRFRKSLVHLIRWEHCPGLGQLNEHRTVVVLWPTDSRDIEHISLDANPLVIIKTKAFNDVRDVGVIYMPLRVDTIQADAFHGLENVTELAFDQMKSDAIGQFAFRGLNKVDRIIISNSAVRVFDSGTSFSVLPSHPTGFRIIIAPRSTAVNVILQLTALIARNLRHNDELAMVVQDGDVDSFPWNSLHSWSMAATDKCTLAVPARGRDLVRAELASACYGLHFMADRAAGRFFPCSVVCFPVVAATVCAQIEAFGESRMMCAID